MKPTRCVVLSEHDFDQWQRRYEVGDAPARLPYAIDALEGENFELTGVRQSSRPTVVKARQVVEHRYGMVVERALRAIPPLTQADVLIALLERQAMLPGLLKSWRVPPYRSTPLVIWSCWLADDIRRGDEIQRAWIKRRIQEADLITHFSHQQTEILVDFGIPEERLFPLTFGVSQNFYTPDPTFDRDIELLAVGQDRGRDYRTLIDAVRGTQLTLDLVCKPENLAGIDVPENVRVHGTVSLAAYRRLLTRAQVVAVPTFEMAYPTGSSVALEAASSGCAVVLSGTPPLRDYFVDTVNARLVGVGDVHEWRTVLHELLKDPVQRARLGSAGRESVTTRFNADAMWREFAEVIRSRGLI